MCEHEETVAQEAWVLREDEGDGNEDEELWCVTIAQEAWVLREDEGDGNEDEELLCVNTRRL